MVRLMLLLSVHDVIEDAGVPAIEIGELFGSSVAAIVVACTDDARQDVGGKNESLADVLAAAAQGGDAALVRLTGELSRAVGELRAG